MIEEQDRQQSENNSLKGYKILLIIMTVILAGLSFLYFQQTRSLRGDRDSLSIAKDTLESRLKDLRFDLDNLRTENETINQSLTIEKHRADSLIDRFQKEASWNRSKVKQYEKELGLLRTVMGGYVRQIDSLNQINSKLTKENVQIRRDLSTERQRAEVAEENAQELSSKIRKGSIVKARSISLKALNNSDKEVTRANRAARLRVDFVLSGNELATPGERDVIVRIIAPSGFLLTNSQSASFEFEGENLAFTASRRIDYQNDDLSVSLYFNGTGITDGKYLVEIYMDGYLAGTSEVILR